jgi:hypothetical protein
MILLAILGNDVAIKASRGREASVSGRPNHCPTCLELRLVGESNRAFGGPQSFVAIVSRIGCTVTIDLVRCREIDDCSEHKPTAIWRAS